MEKPLFANVGGNQFRLLTESIDNGLDKSSLVREGLKKVFSAGNKELSYKRVGGVGLGYIKNVSEASKTALQEARIIAKEYGYKDNESLSKFIKEDGEMSDWDIAASENGLQDPAGTRRSHPESGTSSPEESREVQIGQEILNIISNRTKHPDLTGDITKLAQELIQMHQGQ